jgi:hypothetical protein
MPSPPQGFTVILPGEITQSDLDPQQPPAKLSSYPLTIGIDTPGPNESNYVANDNTGNLLDIINSDTSSTTLSALKMAIDEITLIRTNGRLAINLANENNWSTTQSFANGIIFSNYPNSGRTMDLTALGPSSPFMDPSFCLTFPNTIKGGGDYYWTVNSASGTPLKVDLNPTLGLYSYMNTLDDGSGNMTVRGNLATTTINLDGAGPISKLVDSFNGRTGAVVPASGDYSNYAFVSDAPGAPYIDAKSNVQVCTIKTGPNGVIFWSGSCTTVDPETGNLGLNINNSGSLGNYPGMGPTSTGSYWSSNATGDDPQTLYPVIFNGISTGITTVGSEGIVTTPLSPNTSYDIYMYNSSSSAIQIQWIALYIIGL